MDSDSGKVGTVQASQRSRRSFLGQVGSRALAVAVGLLGLSKEAAASPFCCDLFYSSGGDCRAGGGNGALCVYQCHEFDGYHFLYWSCSQGGTQYYCEECMLLNQQNCFNAQSDNTICSCYTTGGPVT